MSKQQLVFDTTDAESLQYSDSVGAYLRSSTGALITSTNVAGKEALDVRLAEAISVDVSLDASTDSISSHTFDGAGNAIGSTGGSLHISDAGGSITVDAVDFDIRDLAFATDKVDVTGSEVSLDATTLAALETINAVQSGVWDIGTVTTLTGITNDVNIADGGNSITVDAVQLDIDDLNATDDAVSAHMKDGAGVALTSTLIGSDQALDINVVQSVDPGLANTAIQTVVTTLAVADTAQNIIASPLANRKVVYVYNSSNKPVYIGQSGVTEATGFPLLAGVYMELKAGSAIDIEFVGSTVNQEIRTMELS